jgi:hypothetical protein
MEPGDFMNKGIRALGKGQVVDLLKRFGDCYSVPIVSVGSGMGAIESVVPDVKGGWVCVDPDWKSYAKQFVHEGLAEKYWIPFTAPKYSLVKQLVEARPEIVGNCCVFLNWCDPNESDYDIEAVELLKPLGIMAVIERFGKSNGAAGGERFHALYEQSLSDKGPYACFYEAQAETQTTNWIIGNLDIRLVWLHRRDDNDHALPDIPHAVKEPPASFYTYGTLLSLKAMLQMMDEGMYGLKYSS